MTGWLKEEEDGWMQASQGGGDAGGGGLPPWKLSVMQDGEGLVVGLEGGQIGGGSLQLAT
jgi:hypothetical protein